MSKLDRHSSNLKNTKTLQDSKNVIKLLLTNSSRKRCDCFCTFSGLLSNLILEILSAILEYGILLCPLDRKRASLQLKETTLHLMKKENQSVKK